ncbi:MAG: ATPase AAA, partial [Acidimicrobiaceae bacterium]
MAAPDPTTLQAPPPEVVHATELAFLAAWDGGARPPGWALTPRAVVTFVCGSKGETLRLPKAGKPTGDVPASLAVTEKFVGDRALV